MKKFALSLIASSLALAHANAAFVIVGYNFNNSVAGGSNEMGSLNTTGSVEVYDPTNQRLSPATHGFLASQAWLDLSNLSGSNGGTNSNNWGTFGGTTNNAVSGDTPGGALAVSGPDNDGRFVTFRFPTTGQKDLQLSYSTRGTSTGFDTHTWSYSIDNVNFTNIASIGGRTGTSFSTQSVDFSSISALENQAEVFIRLTFSREEGSVGNTGNNRIDNVIFTVPEPSTALFGLMAALGFAVRRRRA